MQNVRAKNPRWSRTGSRSISQAPHRLVSVKRMGCFATYRYLAESERGGRYPLADHGKVVKVSPAGEYGGQGYEEQQSGIGGAAPECRPDKPGQSTGTRAVMNGDNLAFDRRRRVQANAAPELHDEGRYHEGSKQTNLRNNSDDPAGSPRAA